MADKFSITAFTSKQALRPLSFFMVVFAGLFLFPKQGLFSAQPASTIAGLEKTSGPEMFTVGKIVVGEISSAINSGTFRYLQKVFSVAERQGAGLVLIELNTPGGLVTDTKSIISLIGESRIPTAVWVSPEGGSAASAGALIASSAHFLFMAPGSNIGAATPVFPAMGLVDPVVKQKVTNDLTALVRSLCEARGRDPEIFTDMIINSSSISAATAVEKGMIRQLTPSRQDLVTDLNQSQIKIQGRQVRMQVNNPSFHVVAWGVSEQILDTLADPNLSYIFLVLGVALLFLESQAFTGFIAGSFGLLLLLLAAIGLHMVPVNFGAFSLIVASFALFFAEAFITSFGLISIFGLLSLWVGSSFLYSTENSYLSLSQSLILTTVALVVAAGAFVGIFIATEKRKRKKTPVFYKLKGKTAVVAFQLGLDEAGYYRYQIKVDGEVWTARATTQLEPGAKCKISAVPDSEMLLTVKEL